MRHSPRIAYEDLTAESVLVMSEAPVRLEKRRRVQRVTVQYGAAITATCPSMTARAGPAKNISAARRALSLGNRTVSKTAGSYCARAQATVSCAGVVAGGAAAAFVCLPESPSQPDAITTPRQ